jgi:hypothetical protein
VDILGRSSLNFVSSCKGRKISFLHPSFGLWFCSFIIKDRMAKEEHINLFNVSFVWHRGHHTWRANKQGNLCVYAKFNEEVDSCGELWLELMVIS